MNSISVEFMKKMSDFRLIHFIGDSLNVVSLMIIELVWFLKILGDVVVELFLDL